MWAIFRNKKSAVLFVVIIPLSFWILSLASSKAISGIHWLVAKYYTNNLEGYNGLLSFTQKNSPHHKVLQNLSLPFSRATIPEWDHDRFEFHLWGITEIEESGLYLTGSESDDGSWIWIDGEPVLDNGGLHGRRTKMSLVYLNKGKHIIEIKFENLMGDAFLNFFLVLFDGSRRPLAIKSLNTNAMESFSLIMNLLNNLSLIFQKIARYWIVFLGPLFFYQLLFPSRKTDKGDSNSA
jgi:hypothetical protein